MSASFGCIDSAMPHSWNALTLPDIIGIVRNLDPANTGYVNWRVLFNYLVLQLSEIPKVVDLKGMKQENGFAEKEAFIAHKFWFEESERSKDREYSHPFERVLMIKELLF